MTAKEYLNQAYRLEQRIRLLKDNIEETRALSGSISSPGFEQHYNPNRPTEAPYPIEKLWSKVKSFLRKFKARTLDALPNAIQCAFQTVSPSDCSGWFHSCGYSPYF